jgi:hypothetical protein
MVVDERDRRVTSRPVLNARGVIAEHYRDLQSLEVVERARYAIAFEPASDLSLLRTLLQGCEIALYNLADLLRRADADAEHSLPKLAWARGFHRVLVSLSAIGARFTATLVSQGASRVPLHDSPAFLEYLDALKRFDRSLRWRIESGGLDLPGILSGESLASVRFLLVHFVRIANHESTIWERSMIGTAMPAAGMSYAELIASDTLREAVHQHQLTGDTYFTQFRALHQIPELLAAEMNDRLEAAILALREGQMEAAASELVWVNALAEPVAACLPAMVDNLATSDYHDIRENLGLTSGSHSVGIRYHLFTDLYEQVCEEVANCLDAAPTPARSLLIAQLAAFRGFVFGWREQHLHLARNNLGGDSTRSLTGSPDAIAVVRGMAEHARAKDPARSLVAAPEAEPEAAELSAYLREEESLDTLILTATGQVTQASFTDVQERLGFFAGKCPFTKPARRHV